MTLQGNQTFIHKISVIWTFSALSNSNNNTGFKSTQPHCSNHHKSCSFNPLPTLKPWKWPNNYMQLTFTHILNNTTLLNMELCIGNLTQQQTYINPTIISKHKNTSQCQDPYNNQAPPTTSIFHPNIVSHHKHLIPTIHIEICLWLADKNDNFVSWSLQQD